MDTKLKEAQLNSVKELYDLAERNIKKLEAASNFLDVSFKQEQVYITRHILLASTTEDFELAKKQFEKAEEHCWRLLADISNTTAFYIIKKIQEIQHEFAKNKINIFNYFPNFSETLKLARNLETKLIFESETRAHILEKNQIIIDKLLQDVQEIESYSSELKSKLNLERKFYRTSVFTIAIIIFLASLVMSFSISSYSFFGFSKTAQSKTVKDEILDLTKIQSSLIKLQDYVGVQQTILKNIDGEITILNSKKEQLEKAVGINEQAVTALLSTYQSAPKSIAWLEIFISFFVGVLSSLLVLFLQKWYERKSQLEKLTEK